MGQGELVKKLITSDRVLRNNVGGNSTYAKNLYSKLKELEWEIDVESSFHQSKTMSALSEIKLGHSKLDGVIHYPADTGPIYSKNIPTFTTVHGNASLHIANIRPNIGNRIWNQRVKLACKVSTAIVTVSENSKRDIIESFKIEPESINVIYHGINHEVFKPFVSEKEIDVARASLLQKYMIHGDYVLFLGNLEPRKNLESVVAATKSPRWPRNLKLVVVGRYAWGNKSVISDMSSDSRIIYLGFIPIEDVISLLGTAKCLVFPSLYEGWGFPVLEALAVGCTVISSSKGALMESTQGNALYLEDPKSPKEIVDMVRYVIENPSQLEQLRRSGLEFAKKFTWENSAREHDALFSKFLQ
jgi:glycosyltransferase involved in cell wall biosynthesis